MLPFPIISNTNKLPLPTIQIFSSNGYNSHMLKNDVLYAIGTNSGELGLGDTVTRTKWTLVRNGVKKVFKGTPGITFIISTDNKIYVSGDTNPITGNYGFITSFTEYTNSAIFSGLDISLVKDIKCSDAYGFYVLLSTGDVYYCSKNTRTKVQGISDCVQIQTDMEKVIFLTRSGMQYFSGYGRLGSTGLALGQSESISQTSPKYNLNLGSGYLFNTNISWQFYSTDSSTLYSRGQGYYGTMGNGSNADTNIFVEHHFENVLPLNYCKNPYNGNSLTIICSDAIYACGSNDNGMLGIGNTINQNTYQECIDIKFDISTCTDFVCTPRGNYIVADSKLYCTGLIPTMFGLGSSTTYIQVSTD